MVPNNRDSLHLNAVSVSTFSHIKCVQMLGEHREIKRSSEGDKMIIRLTDTE